MALLKYTLATVPEFALQYTMESGGKHPLLEGLATVFWGGGGRDWARGKCECKRIRGCEFQVFDKCGNLPNALILTFDGRGVGASVGSVVEREKHLSDGSITNLQGNRV